MAKINPDASKFIDNYIEKLPNFSREIVQQIRNLIQQANNKVKEDWKWNIPIFQLNDMVCGFAGFKKHVSLTFFNGAAMKDMHTLFSKDCSSKNSRTIKINSIKDINEKQFLNYFKEAFLLSENGVKKEENKEEILIPKLLENALNKNKIAKQNFENMAYTYRKEYALHISDAKREVTKHKRLEKVIFNLEKNIKMHEKYQ